MSRANKETPQERIKKLEKELEDLLEKEAGMDALLGVMDTSDEFTDEAREELCANLEQAREQIMTIESQLDTLYVARGDVISEDEDDHSDRSGISKAVRDVCA